MSGQPVVLVVYSNMCPADLWGKSQAAVTSWYSIDHGRCQDRVMARMLSSSVSELPSTSNHLIVLPRWRYWGWGYKACLWPSVLTLFTPIDLLLNAGCRLGLRCIGASVGHTCSIGPGVNWPWPLFHQSLVCLVGVIPEFSALTPSWPNIWLQSDCLVYLSVALENYIYPARCMLVTCHGWPFSKIQIICID